MRSLNCIAHIRTDFPSKFGIPRQSGLVDELEGTVVFAPEYRDPSALRGLEGYSHIWLIWEFSESELEKWSPTVKPPRLGGNKRVGVFATRSPFRPNPLGLSCVRLTGIEMDTPEGPVLHVAGADLLDGTPIFDIKPYVKADVHEDARFGFTEQVAFAHLQVHIPEALAAQVGEKLPALVKVLENKPIPAYQSDPARVYGMAFAQKQIKFRVVGDTLEVIDII